MKYKRLYLRLTEEKLEYAMHRYHFEHNSANFYQIYHKLVKQMYPVLYYEYDRNNRNKITVVISLGEAPDKFMDHLTKEGAFLDAYIVECLCMELLSVSYEQIKEIIYRERRQFLEKMDFCDLSELEQLIPRLQGEWDGFPIGMNDACVLIPTKTVVFYGWIGMQSCQTLHSCNICTQKTCIFRNQTGEEHDI
jgi:hypothetical protein